MPFEKLEPAESNMPVFHKQPVFLSLLPSGFASYYTSGPSVGA